MRAYCDAGPTCPHLVIDAFADLSFVEDLQADNQYTIARAGRWAPQSFLRLSPTPFALSFAS